MKRKLIINSGDKFGKLTIIKELEPTEYRSGKTKYRYLCKCDCGKEKIVPYVGLKNGTKSCGCLNTGNKIHGLSRNRLFEIYRHLNYRCYHKNNPDYKDYGNRGIKVCAEWLGDNGFFNFKKWSMENGYSEELTLDRIDVNGDYEPNNCRWTTNKVQQRNKRNNFYITYNGETRPCNEWAEIKHMNPHSLYYRLKTAGWSVEKALETPIKSR